jgi:hypothetical protein
MAAQNTSQQLTAASRDLSDHGKLRIEEEEGIAGEESKGSGYQVLIDWKGDRWNLGRRSKNNNLGRK